MAALRQNFADILRPELHTIFDDAYKEIPQVFPQIFNMETSDKDHEIDSGVTGFGFLAQTNENSPIQYEDPVQMFDVTYTHLKYTKGFKVSEELIEDDQWRVIRSKPQALGRAARRTEENQAAQVFINAFTSSQLGGDGEELCSTVHPRSDGGATQSNADANGITLTYDNLETAEIAMRAQLDGKGMKIAVKPNTLVVPPSLRREGLEITKSAKIPGTADNEINIFQGTLKVVDWDYLTSTTAWFLIDSTQSKVQWFWRSRPEMRSDNSFDTGAALFKIQERFSNGFSDWRGVWGSQGDGASYSS